MPRKPRIPSKTGVYHIITKGNNQQAIFLNKTDFDYYLRQINALKSRYVFDLYHYCLMTNHSHLLSRFPNFEDLQSVMRRLNLMYASWFQKRYGYRGHVFQDRFKSFPVEKDSYLLECGRYIERNPLNAQIVMNLNDYRWSSYSFYADGIANNIVTENPFYFELGISENERQLKYREYILTDRPYEEEKAWGRF